MADKRIAVVPGSFDPITSGHIDIIRRAAADYDEVVVAVMINAEKRYMFTLEQREQIARAATEELSNVRVLSSDGMLWMLARDLGACAIVKGVRNEIDRAYELKMAEYNATYYPEAKTVLLEADPALDRVSSTRIRERLHQGLDISDFLPPKALDVLYGIFPKKI